MDIPEMHVWFRQYAQQMGMQEVRTILPEQIDVLLNTSIVDTANQIIRENVGISNDRVITDNSKISQLNSIRTLYKVKEIELLGTATPLPFTYNPEDYFNGKYSSNDEYTGFPETMFIVDFAMNYTKCTTGWTGTGEQIKAPVKSTADGFTTNYFPVRIIDDAYLADTLNDFVLKNRMRSPIATVYSLEKSPKLKVDMYIDKFNKTSGLLENSLAPYKLRMSYISYPAKVKYSEDLSGANVDCDLPEYLHVDIIKHAVDLYRISISGDIYANQQRKENQQRENYRNNANE